MKITATNREEIIADFYEHVRRTGGAPSDWLIGTAKDSRSPFFRNHIMADLGDGLIYREAFTTNGAEAIRDHFVNDCGLEPDEAERRGIERRSALHPADERRGAERRSALLPGKIVFVYR